MAEEILLPNGDDAGWTTGGFADIDELVSSPNDTDFIQTAIDGEGEVIDIDLDNTALTDGDTITNVTVNIRGHINTVGGVGRVRVNLLIGGVIQGGNQITCNIEAITNYAANTLEWNVDWTAAQLNGMQIRLTTVQSAMPTNVQHRVTALDVVITYTPAGGGPLTSNGTPLIDEIAASGVSTQTLKPSGTPLIESPTASGISNILKSSNGNPVIEGIIASGVSILVGGLLTASGNPSIDEVIASGIANATSISISDVNTTESWNDGDAGLVITGIGFL